jgi:Ca2+-binding EF-hand superfamily protein
MRGELTAEEANGNFHSFFSDETNPNGIVSKEEFMAFYAGVSQNIPDDEYFEHMLYSVWGIDCGQRLADTSFGSVINAVSQGKQTPMKQTLTIPAKHKANVVTPELQACYATYGGNNRNYNMAYTQTKRGSTLTSTLLSSNNADRRGQATNYETSMNVAHKPYTQADLQFTKPSSAYAPITAAALQSSGRSPVEQVKIMAYQRSGKCGIRGLIRMLRVMDDNGNRNLDKYELQNGLHTYGLKFTSQQMDELMQFFDRDGNGQISITEFQRALRGPPNDRRMALVRQAYNLLDTNGDETVTFDELKELYDVSKHPDVTKKEKTAAQALSEFIKDWDKNGDNMITLDEFNDYYMDLSAGIEDDDYFELMIRNAWHLSGGVGVCANTSCRRVLVSHTNGKQTVEEIKNDIRIGPKELGKMIQNLKDQGIDDVKEIFLSY